MRGIRDAPDPEAASLMPLFEAGRAALSARAAPEEGIVGAKSNYGIALFLTIRYTGIHMQASTINIKKGAIV